MKVVGYIDDKRVEYEVDESIVYPNWHVAERSIRLVLTDDVKTRLLTLKQEQELLGTQPEASMIIEYLRTITVPIHTEGTTTYIYLEEIYPEHEKVLTKYGVIIEKKQ